MDIYTDGSCSPNPGQGGWAYVIPEKGIEMSGAESDTTNNRMEMKAILEALRGTTGAVRIYSDSKWCISTLTRAWKAKKNLDLIEEGRRLMKGRDVKFHWVKGHSGHVHNDRADHLATRAGRKRTSFGI